MGDTYSMRIWMKPEKMAQYGLTPSDVTAVLNEQNIEAPTGSLAESSDNVFQYTMKYKGRLKSTEEFENIVLRSQKTVPYFGSKILLRWNWEENHTVFTGKPTEFPELPL